jgi:mRNA interferase RelE/StbE
MGSYKVVFKNSASKEFRELPVEIKKRVGVRVDQLENNPFPPGTERLKAYSNPPVYRIRVGDYRILYSVYSSQKIVIIYAVAHRREVYR